MSSNFDLRKFLTENQLTTTAKAVAEAPNIPMPGNKPKMPPVPGQGSNNQAPKNTGASDKAKAVAKEALFQVIASTSTLKNAGVLDANEVKQLEDLCNKAMGNLDEGATSKAITEWDDKSVKDYADAMSTAFGNKPKDKEDKKPVSEMNGGYIEVMGDEFEESMDLLAAAWSKWKSGPATEEEDIEPAKADVLSYVKSVLV